MNLDHVLSLIIFATGAPFLAVFITNLRRTLRRCRVVPKNGPTGGRPTGPVQGCARRMRADPASVTGTLATAGS
jgi:hypothetical protein